MIRRAWQLLLSVRTALVLILALTVATLVGTVLIQTPMQIPLQGPEHDAWLDKVRPRFGAATDAMAMVGLFNVFRTWWFEALVVALALSISACSIHRARTMWRESSRPPVRLAPAMFERPGTAEARTPRAPRYAAAGLDAALHARGYRILAQERDGVTHVYADRHRFARFGTLLSHASLVLLLVTAGLGTQVRWTDDGFVVPEGSTRDLGLNGLAVRADTFVAEYYPTGEPSDFRSDLVLFEDGKEVRRKTIRVNDPLEYKGVRFYQSFFGPSVELRVTDGGGRVLYQDGVALAWRVQGERPAGPVSLPEKNMIAYVVAPSTGGKGDALIRPGEMRVEVYRNGSSSPAVMKNVSTGGEVELAGLRFAFLRERQFTGLRVARDPTVPIVWVASTLFVLGLAAVFAFPYRRLWARVDATEDTTRIAVVTVGRRVGDGSDDLDTIARDAAREALRR